MKRARWNDWFASLYRSSLPVAHLSDAPGRQLVVTGDIARMQDKTTESSAWFFYVLGVKYRSQVKRSTSCPVRAGSDGMKAVRGRINGSRNDSNQFSERIFRAGDSNQQPLCIKLCALTTAFSNSKYKKNKTFQQISFRINR